jgi:predicted nucleic acid-binding protein
MLSFLRDEPGAEKVVAVLINARDGKCKIHMNAVNLVEVYYDIFRAAGKAKADEEIAMIKKLPIVIQTEITDKIFEEAGRLKASYKISFADSFALAQAIVTDGELLTSDHHEFDVLEGREPVRFQWIR